MDNKRSQAMEAPQLNQPGADQVLLGQVALITGAAKGIGRAIALRLAHEGADIALHYRSNPEQADAVAEEIRAMGRRVTLLQADLTDSQAMEQMAQQFEAAYDRLDILVNNAGITSDNLLFSMTAEEMEQVLRTNLLAPMLLTQRLGMLMMRRRYGRIINISSSAASKPGRGQSNYAAAKGGLEAFTKAMAVELAPRGILVNGVAPGVIETEMSARIRDLAAEQILDRLLLKRYADPMEVADAVLYLASPRNRYVTGEIVHLDGGLKMA